MVPAGAASMISALAVIAEIGESCAKGFRSCDDIRCCACFCPVLGCIIFTCSAVTTLNLICNHQDSVVIADLADCFYPLDGCRDKSTFALERLNDHAGDLTCRCALVKDSLKLINVILNCLFLCISFWCTVYIWIWCTKDSCWERSHAYCIGFLLSVPWSGFVLPVGKRL